MSTLAVFSFENSQVRTTGSVETPLFVAIDVAAALGYQRARDAVTQHCDPDDIIKAEIETKGGRQTVNCVNESGLYALIFGSKLESAKRFKRWVTNEVLPAIRKQGRFECPAADHIPPAYLTLEHQYAIQSEVAKRVHKDNVRYQTVYQALKARFRVPKYTCILDRDFEAAVHFIRTCNLRVPEVPEQKPEPQVKTYTVTETFLERVRAFVYYWRYLHRADLERFLCLMQSLNSPYAAQFAEAIKNLNLILLEGNLEQLGFPVKELPAYKTLMSSK